MNNLGRLSASYFVRSFLPAFIKISLPITIAAFSAYVVMLPRNEFAYALHVDEWIHFGNINKIVETGSLDSPPNYEIGFHLFVLELSTLTGLDLTVIFHWLPSILAVIVVSLSYILGKRFNAGVECAFLAAILPTSIRLLGSAFAVPVTVALSLFPFLLLILFVDSKSFRYLVLYSLTLLSLGLYHPTSSIVLGIVTSAVGISIGLSEKRFRWIGGLVISLLIPLLIALFMQSSAVSRTLLSVISKHDESVFLWPPNFIELLGYTRFLVFVFGFFILLLTWKSKNLALVGAFFCLLVFLVAHYELGFGYQTLADRGLLHLMLLAAIIGGIGAARLRTMYTSAPQRLVGLSRGIGLMLVVGVTIFSFRDGLSSYQSANYYRLVDDRIIGDFLWLKDNLDSKNRTAVLRTDVAFAYSAVTQRPTYATEAFPFLNDRGRDAMAFLFAASPETYDSWLRDRRVFIVYAPHWVEAGPDLDKIRSNVYLSSELLRPSK